MPWASAYWPPLPIVWRPPVSKVYFLPPNEIGSPRNNFDHRNHIPSKCQRILFGHSDEVWNVQFSNNGKFLASASKDSVIVIWSLEVGPLPLPFVAATLVFLKTNKRTNKQANKTQAHSVLHELTQHDASVSFLRWSPNDEMLLTCSKDRSIKIWDTKVGNLLFLPMLNWNHFLVYHYSSLELCFFPFRDTVMMLLVVIGYPMEKVSSQGAVIRIYISGFKLFLQARSFEKRIQSRQFFDYNITKDLEGRIKKSWRISRIFDLVVHPNGTQVLLACEKSLRICCLNSAEENL